MMSKSRGPCPAISAAKMGHTVSVETRLKISAKLMGRKNGPRTKEMSAKIGAAHRKTLGAYEREAHWENGCLIHPAGSNCDANRIARKVYQLRHDAINNRNIYVCHHCDNPWCILDEHHFLGTHKDNMADASKKGRLKKSKEYWKKFSERRTGHIVTEETRRKISETKLRNRRLKNEKQNMGSMA